MLKHQLSRFFTAQKTLKEVDGKIALLVERLSKVPERGAVLNEFHAAGTRFSAHLSSVLLFWGISGELEFFMLIAKHQR